MLRGRIVWSVCNSLMHLGHPMGLLVVMHGYRILRGLGRWGRGRIAMKCIVLFQIILHLLLHFGCDLRSVRAPCVHLCVAPRVVEINMLFVFR